MKERQEEETNKKMKINGLYCRFPRVKLFFSRTDTRNIMPLCFTMPHLMCGPQKKQIIIIRVLISFCASTVHNCTARIDTTDT